MMADQQSSSQTPLTESVQYDIDRLENETSFELTPNAEILTENDVQMSDMPEMPAYIDHRASSLDGQRHASSGARKFLSRTNDGDTSTAIEFNIMPIRPILSGRLARSKLGKSPPPTQHQQDAEIVSLPARSEDYQTGPTIDNARCQSSDDAFNITDGVYAISNIRSSTDQSQLQRKGSSVRSLLVVDPKGSEDLVSDEHVNTDGQEVPTLVVSTEEHSLSIQTTEDGVTVLLDDTTLGSTNEDLSLDRNTATHPAAVPNPTIESNGHIDTRSTITDHIPRAGHSFRDITNSQHRVEKNRWTSRRNQRSKTDVQFFSNGPAVPSDGPSEEDLLYLLMHYSREREQQQSKSRQAYDRLKSQNRDSQKMQATLKEDFEVACIERDRLQVDVRESRNELDVFKQKYKKLKAWALEMNNEYAVLRQEGSNLKSTLFSLRSQTTAFWEPVKAVLASNQSLVMTVTNIKNNLADAQRSVSNLKIDLLNAQSTITEKTAELRTLKAVGAEHKSYVRQLSVLQNNFDNRTLTQQANIELALIALSDRVKRIPIEICSSEDLVECLSLVKTMSASDVATVPILEDIKVMIATLVEQQGLVQKEVNDSLKGVCSSKQMSLLSEDIVSINNNIKIWQPDLQVVKELQQENAKLQERTRGDAAIRQLIEDSYYSVKSQHVEAQKTNDKLITSLISIRQNESNSRRQQVCDFETQLSAVTTRWNSAAKELGEAKVRLGAYESEVTNLKCRLAEFEQRLSTQENDFKAHYEIQLAELHTRTTAEQNTLKADFDAQLQIKNEAIIAAQDALQQVQSEALIAKKELTRLSATQEKTDEELILTKDELSVSTEMLRRQQAIVTKLLQEAEIAQTRIATITALERDIAEKEVTISNFDAVANKLKRVQRELEQVRDQSSAKENSIALLEEKLENANRSASESCELERQLLDCQQNLHAQTAQIDSMRAQCIASDKVKQDLEQKDVEINRMRTLLESVRETHQRLQDIETEKTNLEKEIDIIRKKLSEALESSQHTYMLEESHREKDVAIDEMKHQLAQAHRFESDLNTLKDQLKEKDDHLASQARYIEQLQTQVTQANGAQHHGDNLEGLSTQNTDLSITTQDYTTDQSDTCARNQNSGELVAMGNESQSGVNPHVIMCGTPTVARVETGDHLVTNDSQTSLIPDSQVELATDSHGGLPISVQAGSTRVQGISSPLSDINEDYLDTEPDESDPGYSQTTPRMFSSHPDEQDMYDIPLSSPHHPTRHRISRKLSRHPSSVASHEEMLLQASETGQSSSPRTSIVHRTHADSNTMNVLASSLQDTGRRPQDNGKSHRRSIGQKQTSAYGQQAVSATGGLQATNSVTREKNIPNSAVKRRVDNIAADNNDRFSGKRLRSNPSDSIAASSNNARVDLAITQESLNSPATRGTQSAAADGSTGTKGKSKRSKGSRKPRKQDRYAARFGGSSQG